MQQRRGTAAQWTAANPILAAGEIGFETDTNKFKMGNGSSVWTALTYFANAAELAALLDGAPDALNTLNELAAAINDDPAFFTNFGNTLGESIATNINTFRLETTDVHGIVDTEELATKAYADNAVSTHESDTSVHGIANTADLVTQSMLSDAVSAAEVDQASLAGTGLDWNSEDERFDIDSTVATTAYADTAVSTHNSGTTDVHGIADTSLLATQSYADNAEADAITAAGTAADTKISTAVAALTKSSVGLANVDNTADADKPVSTATQTALDLKANLAGPTFTGTVTTDDLIVEGDLTVTGTTTTINATDLSITDPLIYLASNQYTEDVLDVGFLAATGAPGGTEADHLHSGFFRDASDSKKWKLVSNVPHPVGNVVDITNATKETLVVGALEATTVNPSSGVVFSDGTQTKEGVPSRTPIIQKTASYALSTLTHRDSMIEVSSASATTITIPLDSTVDYPIGTTIDILQTNTGQVTIAPVSGSVTVNATPGLKLRTRWSSATLMKRAANTWVVYGDLTA